MKIEDILNKPIKDNVTGDILIFKEYCYESDRLFINSDPYKGPVNYIDLPKFINNLQTRWQFINIQPKYIIYE